MIGVDVFCGAGGLTRGMLNAGVQMILGIDINEDYKRTYEENNTPAVFLSRDVSTLTGDDIRAHLLKREEHELVLVGCAPCQPFSTHHRGASRYRDGRLLSEFGRLVDELRPEWVFMENVPGLAEIPGFSTFRRFTKILNRLRYRFDCRVVDAKRFGVPQTRRRCMLIASRRTTPVLPGATHGPGLLPYRTVREAIGTLPQIAAGATHPRVPNHQAAKLSDINLLRLRRTPHDGGSRSHWPDEIVLKCHRESDGHQDVYGRMHWDAPAPTLTCKCFSISNGRYGHPEQDRAISLREAACIQTFGMGYVFYGKSQRSIGEQIGNAVPVALAEAVGSQLLSLSRASQRRSERRKQSG